MILNANFWMKVGEQTYIKRYYAMALHFKTRLKEQIDSIAYVVLIPVYCLFQHLNNKEVHMYMNIILTNYEHSLYRRSNQDVHQLECR